MQCQPKDKVEHKLKCFQECCREAGLKVTHQRREVFQEIAEAMDHPSAETLHSRVRERIPAISLDTVYRTLATFEEMGLIGKVQLSDDSFRFDPFHEPHHHLFCVECKGITDFDWNEADALPLPEELEGWGEVTDRQVVLRGVCAKCLPKS